MNSKASMGQQFLLGGKGNKNGVAVTYLYSGGLSLGMLKQYVLNVYPAQSLYSIQSTYPTIFDSSYIVYDALGLSGGWDHLHLFARIKCQAGHAFRLWPLQHQCSRI